MRVIELLLKSKLSSTTVVWVLLGALTLVFPLLSKAQTNDKGAVVINGQISTQTCVLAIAESKDVLVSVSNNYTMKLGNVPLSSANTVAVGDTFGPAKTVYFYTTASPASFIGTCSGGPRFDVGLTIPSDKILAINNQSVLLGNGTVDTGAAGGVALSLKSKMSTFILSGNFVGDTNLDLINTSPVGVLLSGKKNLIDDLGAGGNQRVYALTTQFVKTSNTVTAGAYNTTIAVNLWWR